MYSINVYFVFKQLLILTTICFGVKPLETVFYYVRKDVTGTTQNTYKP